MINDGIIVSYLQIKRKLFAKIVNNTYKNRKDC